MGPAASVLLLLLGWTRLSVWETATVTAWYEGTIVLPCNTGALPPEEIIFIKWKYVKDDGTPGDLLIKQRSSDQVTIQATDNYAQRVSIDDKFSLHISRASLKDQKNFSCMVASVSGLQEDSLYVVVKKEPSSVQIITKSEFLKKDKLTEVGTCVAVDANPAANISWKMNGKPLMADGKAVVITSSVQLSPVTDLSTTSSVLQYAAAKQDVDAVFTCMSTYESSSQETDLEPLPVHYPSEKASLLTLPKRDIVEGDNVTLKCHGDGSPAPSSFFFLIKGNKYLVQDSDNYTVTFISREDSGEYKCSLVDNEGITASKEIIVNYMDLSINLTGRVVKKVGDPLHVEIEMSSSGNAAVEWTKDFLLKNAPAPMNGGSKEVWKCSGSNWKKVKEPKFSRLTYADAGCYRCEGSIPGLKKHRNFELVVEGKPIIINLSHRSVGKDQFLTCEAEGVPEPQVQWSIKGSQENRSHIDGKEIYEITTSTTNLNVTCRVYNSLGEDAKTIFVPSEDFLNHPGFIAVVVVAAVIIIAVVVTICLLCWKKSRNGQKEEVGTADERVFFRNDSQR